VNRRSAESSGLVFGEETLDLYFDLVPPLSDNSCFPYSYQISVYTFCVYLGSSIYTPSTDGVMRDFHIGYVPATLGLALYILGCMDGLPSKHSE
jgi:hypothetical protein